MNPNKHISKLYTHKKYIAICCAGSSIYDNQKYDYDLIRKECFTVGINNFNAFDCDMYTFFDTEDYPYFKNLINKKKATLLVNACNEWKICNINMLEEPHVFSEYYHYHMINDIIGSHSEEWIDKGTFTLPIIIQVFRLFQPEKPILLFGVDLNSTYNAKMVEKLDDDQIHMCKQFFQAAAIEIPRFRYEFENKKDCVEKGFHQTLNYHENLVEQIVLQKKNKRYNYIYSGVINCNPDSAIPHEIFPKCDYKAILTEKK